MFNLLESVLKDFRSCFSREKAYAWFVICTIGLLVRRDFLGVTSIIRVLALNYTQYENLVNFFHSDAWKADEIRNKWAQIVCSKAPLVEVDGRIILLGDGVKQSKEGFFMAAVKRLHQESENSGKAEYIYGHLFGGIGILAGSVKKMFCIPLHMTIQDGLKSVAKWDNPEAPNKTHVVQMYENAVNIIKELGRGAYFVVDRYFASAPGLAVVKKWNESHNPDEHMHVITKLKGRAVGWSLLPPEAGKKNVGRPPKKGKTKIEIEAFFDRPSLFVKMYLNVYGEWKTVEVYTIDMVWGRGVYMPARVVLTIMDGARSMLLCTDMSLPPQEIIRLYSYRQKIECTFREFKQQLGGFLYHFWTKAVPKLNHFSKQKDWDPLSTVENEDDRRRILRNIKATEGFVLFASIACGILQLIALTCDSSEMIRERYLRTPSKEIPSEATVRSYIQTHIFSLLLKHPNSFITQYIRAKQKDKIEEIAA